MTVFVPYVCLEQYAFMFYIFPSFHAGAAMMEGTLQENILSLVMNGVWLLILTKRSMKQSL